ncbi:hypothetical protein MKB22_003232 [Salmonella enterica]|nr:hypothetical protein [Salmonella enterica]
MSGLLPYFVNLRAKVKSGLKDVVFWISAKSDARALREMENALEDADIKRSAFFKDAVITGLPVYNDLPQEGELDFTWCERYVFSDDTGTWLPVVPAQPESADSDNVSIGEEHTDENATDNTDSGDTAGTSDKVVGSEMATGTVPSWDVNVNGEPMADVEKLMLHPVATLSERHRILSQFILEDKFSRQITPEQLAEVNRLEMDISNNYIQDMLQACHNVPAIQKLDTPDLWKFTDAVKRIFPQDKQSALYLMTDFAQAFANTEYIDRGLLVNEWCAGRYVSRIEKPTAASASEVPATQKKPVAKAVEVEYPRRSEKATHRTINIEIASALIVPEEIEPDSNNTYDYVDGWSACRAAMLQGGEPVSQTYELPQTQLEQIADLYEMQFDDGRTCAFHTDGAKAAQWLLACDGNKVQEYVRIERYQESVIGNSPVIPDGYALVPVEPTDEMIAAAMNCEDALFNSDESFCVQFGNIYEAMLAAAPQPEASDGK